MSPASPARVHVLGTAQDGGVPHPGCDCARCRSGRADPARRRRVACVAVEGVTGKTFLVDAGPDLPDQLEALACATGRGARVVDAVAITHAHLGHYLGLAFFGKEAMHTRSLPVYGTPSVARFVKGNRPWAHLVEREEIELRTIAPGVPLQFDGVMIHAFLSPHRGEDTDTIGFEIHGPKRRLLYVSDADVFPPEILDRIREADVALIDGTFFSPEELPHREIFEVRHPYVVDTIEKLRGARGQILFTHMNHTNPLLDPDSKESRSLPRGFGVAKEGMIFEL
jgi:pyrroloquinoline quinone biosynthesis protein B